MKKIFTILKTWFCKHEFVTIHTYDIETHKAYCFKCGNKYVINHRYKWKFKLDEESEKDYEQLRKDLQQFQVYYSQKENDLPDAAKKQNS